MPEPIRSRGVFYETLGAYLRGLPAGSRRFWILVPLTGVIAGLGAVASVHWLGLVQRLAWGRSEALLGAAELASPARRALVPLAAGLLVTFVALASRRVAAGHGTARIIEAIWSRQARLSLLAAIGRGLLSLAIVGMGASLGREGALIYFGAAAGSWLGRHFALDDDQRKLLIACGASAGIAAAYNTPIGAALFGLEVFLGGLALEFYGPIIFACVAATLLSRVLLFDHPSYVIPHYRLTHPSELAVYLVVGVVVGVVSALFVRTVDLSERAVLAVPAKWRPLLPTFALGLVGMTGILFPQVFGNGYDTVNLALIGALPLRLLLLLPLFKLVLSVACASSGAPGALFTPSLYVGGLVGGALGVAAHHLFPHVVPAETGGYVLVGMAAILAGSTHATLAAPLMLFELTGSYELILPLLGASVVATVVSRVLTRESIYTAPLRRLGVELPRISRPAWMQREGVAKLVRDDPVRVAPGARLADVVLAFAQLPDGDPLFVVDETGGLRGAIPAQVLQEALVERPNLDLIVAADLMRTAPTVSVDASLWEVTRRALAASTTRLAVLAPREGYRFVGTLATADILKAAARA
jgi:CIC family chloride channel protein